MNLKLMLVASWRVLSKMGFKSGFCASSICSSEADNAKNFQVLSDLMFLTNKCLKFGRNG